MKLSYNWLQDFIDLKDLDIKEVAEKLTMGAFEVESIESTQKSIDSKVVLGEIKSIEKHPDADKLQVTQTCIGNETFQIVCGASNIAVGQKVPVATVGAMVTNRKDGSEFKIKKSKIRGVESCGMLCSADELALTENQVTKIKEKQGDGIYLLDDPNQDLENIAKDHKLGTSIQEILGRQNDFVLEVGARSNRGDALSVFGQARELAAVLKKQVKKPHENIAFENNDKFIYDAGIKTVEPKIEDNLDCSLFYTVSIEGIEIKESPQWLQDRINAMGTKSINNVVDISNYVLLELGQPMHFYDREKIHGNELLVRRAQAGEKITTLEKKTHELDPSNLVIADAQGPTSLAGVMGGLNSSINDGTKNLTIEVAVFDPATVRKSSRSAGVESESKRRYERGVDKAYTKVALLRALELLAEHACPQGQKIKVSAIQNAGSEEIEQKLTSLRTNQIKRLLGIDCPDDKTIELLNRLDLKLQEKKKGELVFSIPSYRQNDITREIDLIEEIGRLYGFDQIQPQSPETLVSMSPNKNVNKRQKSINKIEQGFVAAGFSEVKLSSLIGDSLSELNQSCSSSNSKQAIHMDNPLSREHSFLRQSMLPGLIQAATRNYSYDKGSDIRLFELGKVYNFNGDEKQAKQEDCIEEARFAAVFIANETHWADNSKNKAANFYKIKKIIEELFPRAKFQNLDSSDQLSFHPGISTTVINDKRFAGVIAKLHPNLTKNWDLPDESYVCELIFPGSKAKKFKAFAYTPIIERDLTVDSQQGLTSQEIVDLVLKNAGKDFQDIKLISLYHPENEDCNKEKSTTFRLKWQSENETLTGESIDKEVEKLKLLLEDQLKVTFRA